MVNTIRLIWLPATREKLELFFLKVVDVGVGMNGFHEIKMRSRESAQNVKALNGMYRRSKLASRIESLDKQKQELYTPLCLP